MALLTARAVVVVTLKLNDLANGLMVCPGSASLVLRVRAAAVMAKMADVCAKEQHYGLQRNLNY